MAFEGLLVTEIFHSIQGETTHAGLRYAFVRLTGCNLRCAYCDSEYAFKGGTRVSIDEVVARIASFGVTHVLLTGGEPLLQPNIRKLIDALAQNNYTISIETHGEHPLSVLERERRKVRVVMDIKTPGSKMFRGGFRNNLSQLLPGDEIKFVIATREDLEFAEKWARLLRGADVGVAGSDTGPPVPRALSQWIAEGVIPILFSPVEPKPGAVDSTPPEKDPVTLKWMAEEVLDRKLDVRIQVQLHKWIWGRDRTGV